MSENIEYAVVLSAREVELLNVEQLDWMFEGLQVHLQTDQLFHYWTWQWV